MTETNPETDPASNRASISATGPAITAAHTDRFGDEAVVETSFGETTVTVPPKAWTRALTTARDELGLTFLDWLTAVDEEEEGFTIVAHVCAVTDGTLPRASRLLLRTRIPDDAPELASATSVYRGANWHERETFEMFGITFTDHPNLIPLLLPDGFEGHPLRKDFVLAARVAKEWPGVKEPGEGGHAPGKATPTATRRRMVPPGVPDGWLKPLPEPIAASEPEVVVESAPEPDPGTSGEPKPEPAVDADPEPATPVEPKLEPTADAEPNPEPNPDPEPDPNPDPEPEAKP